MFGCFSCDRDDQRFFKKKTQPLKLPLTLSLSLRENHVVFSLQGLSDEVSNMFYHALQNVSRIDYYQVSNNPEIKQKHSIYHLGVKLTNTAALTDMFWFLNQKNIATSALIKSLPTEVNNLVQNCYDKAMLNQKPLPDYVEPVHLRQARRF